MRETLDQFIERRRNTPDGYFYCEWCDNLTSMDDYHDNETIKEGPICGECNFEHEETYEC